MIQLTTILLGISVLFFVFLGVKKVMKSKNLCVICTTITTSWIILLALYLLEIFIDTTILAILMGHTSLGVYYILERRVKERLLIFRLPYILTSITIIYFVLGGFLLDAFYFIFALWGLFLIIYLLRNNKLAGEILECCKKW